jgi:hypothetical protein
MKMPDMKNREIDDTFCSYSTSPNNSKIGKIHIFSIKKLPILEIAHLEIRVEVFAFEFYRVFRNILHFFAEESKSMNSCPLNLNMVSTESSI